MTKTKSICTGCDMTPVTKSNCVIRAPFHDQNYEYKEWFDVSGPFLASLGAGCDDMHFSTRTEISTKCGPNVSVMSGIKAQMSSLPVDETSMYCIQGDFTLLTKAYTAEEITTLRQSAYDRASSNVDTDATYENLSITDTGNEFDLTDFYYLTYQFSDAYTQKVFDPYDLRSVLYYPNADGCDDDCQLGLASNDNEDKELDIWKDRFLSKINVILFYTWTHLGGWLLNIQFSSAAAYNGSQVHSFMKAAYTAQLHTKCAELWELHVGDTVVFCSSDTMLPSEINASECNIDKQAYTVQVSLNSLSSKVTDITTALWAAMRCLDPHAPAPCEEVQFKFVVNSIITNEDCEHFISTSSCIPAPRNLYDCCP